MDKTTAQKPNKNAVLTASYGNAIIHVVIKDKNGVVAEDDVFAITSMNSVGLFDVLPFHTNFISLIRNTLTLHGQKGKKEMKIGVGLLRVSENEISIYLGLPDPDTKTTAASFPSLQTPPPKTT